MSRMPKKLLGITVALAVAIWASLSRVEMVVPRWTIVVTTAEGKPIGGVPVLQSWIHQTVEEYPHSEVRVTDVNGTAVFPARELSVARAARWAGALGIVARRLHRASFGPLGHVIVGIEGSTNGCELLAYDPPLGTPPTPILTACRVSGSYSIKPFPSKPPPEDPGRVVP